jgi:hypothetical protein
MLAARLYRVFPRKLEKVMKFYDPFTKEHVTGLAEMAGVAAKVWGLGYVEARLLRLAARLHDLGKDIDDYYYCIVTLPKKLGIHDLDLSRMKVEHPFQSENLLDREDFYAPVELRILIRNHHDVRLLFADPDYQDLPAHGKAVVRAALEKLMVLDWLGGYTEVFRPSNWFDHVALDTDAIAAGIKARYGHVFEIDVASFVEKLLAHHEALIILRGNMRHHPPLIGGFIKSWTEEPHHYRQRNPFESLKDQISSLRPEKDLAGVKISNPLTKT